MTYYIYMKEVFVLEDYNIAGRIEELCNTLENALAELNEYKDDPDISIS